MKKILSLIPFTILYLGTIGKANLPLSVDYIKNEGQWENAVLFKVDLFGGWAFLEKDAITYKFIEQTHQHGTKKQQNEIIHGHVYKVKWLNANSSVKIKESNKQDYYNNYFIGNDERKWKSNVGIYKTVHYQNIYPNIDFKIYSENTSMKSDYIIHPNGNIKDLKFKYDGVDAIQISEEGKLKISTSINTIYELKPYAYQIINGTQNEIPCKYVLQNNILTFHLPDGYDKTKDLIIDPTLIFSSYSGSFSDNWGSSATYDNSGNMFLGGIALGASYPTTVGAFQTNFGGGSGSQPCDIAITKFNASGTTKLFSTYLGGSSNELLASLISTSNNELIAVLTTSSTNYPTTSNAFDRTFNGGSSAIAYEISLPNGADIAVTKFNAAGSALLGSTYLGGSGNDGTNLSSATAFNYGDESRSDVALDIAGNVYVTSTTTSNNIPNTSGKAQASYGGGNSDGLLAKFNSDLSVLSWASYFGGSGTDASYSMGLDKNNNIFICGGTTSNNIPGRTNGLNTNYLGGSADGFVAKFDNNGNTVLSSSYLGTSSYDQSYILDLDINNNIYLFGQTLGAYPVSANVYSNTGGKQFIHKLNNSLNSTTFSTVFGSTNSSDINITPTALLVDVCENIYAVGWGGNVNNQGTTFGMAVTSDAFKSTTDGSDFYLINLNRNASSLKYATFFGENGGVGDHVDGGTSRFDKNGIVYEAVCASCGATNSFPTTVGVAGPNNNSNNCNMAGFKFNFNLTGLQIISAAANPSNGCAPQNVSFSYTSTQPGTQWFWDFGDGSSSTSEFPTHTYTNEGTYTVRFIIRDPDNCNPVDSTTVTVRINGRKTSTINRTICQGQSVTIGNQTFSTQGTFNVTLQSSNGCDSVVTLNLTINNRIINPISREICQGESVSVGNNIYTQSGNYSDTIRTGQGCDSIVNLNLIVHPNKTSTLNSVICQGQSVSVGGQTFSTNGNFIINTTTSKGCDSTINLSLVVNPIKNTQISTTICQGQSVSIGNQTFNQSGNYTVTLLSSQNCDSIVTLNLTVNPTKTTTINRTICEGESVSVGNQTFSNSGNYVVTLQSAQQCDSIINLTLIVNPDKTTNLNYVVCTGTPVTIGNQTFNQSGNYTVSLRSSAGCDSIVNLSLTETDTITENIERTICLNQSFTVGNQTFNEAGNYTVYLTAVDGCDSVLNLSLTVLDTLKESISSTICNGDSIVIGRQVFKETGNYSIPLQAASGCDSLVLLNLTKLDDKFTEIDSAICNGESISIGNQTFNEAGEYEILFSSSEGCDSTVLLNLVLNPLPVINAIADTNLVKSGTEVQLDVITNEVLNYIWLPNSVSQQTIKNPTAIVITPTWFVVTATNPQTQCSEKDSVFIDIELLPCAKENIFIPNAFTPNGDDKNDVLFVRSSILKSFHLEIYNRWGIKVFETDDLSKGWDGTIKGQAAPTEAYGYFFKGECIQGQEITMKGNVTLFR